MEQDEATAFLVGGSGGTSCTFPTVGTVHRGVVMAFKMADVRDIKSGEPMLWPNGDKQRQMIITIQTDERDESNEDDTGIRRLFVKNQMRQAVSEALLKAGVKSMDDAIGGKLAVRFIREEPSKTRGFNPTKVYDAAFQAGPKEADVKMNLEGMKALAFSDFSDSIT